MEGVLEKGALYRVLLGLAHEGGTGILTVQGEEEIIAFSLLGGEVVAADALNTTLEEALGELLVRRELVPAEEYGGLAAEYQSGGGRVIDLLVERAYLTREQLLEILRDHTYRLCLEAFTWQRGEYRFYQGEEVAYEDGFHAIGIDELAVRVTTDLGPSGPLSGGVADAGTVARRLPGAEATPEELAGAVRGAVPPPTAAVVFAQIDGRRSLEAIAAGAGTSLFTVQHLVQRWADEGLVTTCEPVPPPEPLPDGLTAPSPAAVTAPVPFTPEIPPPFDLVDLQKDADVLPVLPKRPQPSSETPWPARVMGLALWAAALFLLIWQPSRVLLPFPWQGGLREALQTEQRGVLHLKIERAATTYFLLNGRFPEELEELRAAGLLTSRDLADPSGRSLVMSSATVSYRVESATGDALDDDMTLRGTIAGNVLLDPTFRLPDAAEEPPLVLLD